MKARSYPASFLAALLFIAFLLVCKSASGYYNIPPDLRGDGVLTLYRPVMNERETFKYRNKRGKYSQKAMDAFAHFFRCRMTHEETPIDPQLIEILDSIEDHFGAKEIRLISAYRSPTRNSKMRRRNRRVAKESFHMQGMAADIEVPGVSARRVRDYAYKLNQGGVGYYSRRSFIHVDTGPLRTWGFKPRRSLKRIAPAMSHK